LTIQTKIIHSDFDQQFIVHPISKNLILKINRNAVKQSVKSLILTDYFERPFNPDLGCNIRAYLFEPLVPITQHLMENAISECITNYEPRAVLNRVLVEDAPEKNGVSITVIFSIKNDPEPITLDLILERVR
tara:strand:+ start:182 stop:577 length:396 start_codon:yes stop_codon:yes gene_type:complete